MEMVFGELVPRAGVERARWAERIYNNNTMARNGVQLVSRVLPN